MQASGTNSTLREVEFINESNGWINGGSNWTLQKSNVTVNLYAVDFVDSNNGFAVGSNWTVLKTIDGGKTWINISNTIPEVSFIDANIGLVLTRWDRIVFTKG
ncbi:MAG: YCF48-related protein [Methanosarcinales archaeon]